LAMKKTTLLIGVGAFLVAATVAGWAALAIYFVVKDVALYQGKGGGEETVGTDETATSEYKIRFGTVESDLEGKDHLTKETTTIPMRLQDTGFRYGVEITPPDNEPYTYHLVFHFSAAPKVVTGDGFENLIPSKTLQTKEVTVPGGVMVDENGFDPGDPMGEQSLDVYINGKLVKTIQYTVVADTGD